MKKDNTSSLSPRTIWSLAFLILALIVPGAQGQEAHAPEAQAAETTAQPARPAPAGFLAEFIAAQDRFGGKIVSLAQAIPADKYSWRPTEGVRSIGEALMHIAQTNFGTAQSMGAPLPPGLPSDMSQVTDKAQITQLVEMSFKLTGGIAHGMAGMDLSQPVPQSNGLSMNGALLNFAEHHGEHLGQLIAYSRSVGVVPPWSR